MFQIIKLSEDDNIAVSPMDIPENVLIEVHNIKTQTKIPQGHKISIKEIKKGEKIFKYGQIIGEATTNIQAGEHVHNHNLAFVEFKRNTFNQSTNNINLDLSSVSNFPPEIETFLTQIGMPINKISITRANINTSYNNRNLFKFDLDGITNLANFNIDIQATINEQYPEKSNYQAFKLTISNLSKESQEMLALIQAQSGMVMPMQNGAITFDIKDMLNMGQNPFQQ